MIDQHSLPRNSLGRSRRVIRSGCAKDILKTELRLNGQLVVGIVALMVADGTDFIIRARILFRHGDIVHAKADFRQHAL